MLLEYKLLRVIVKSIHPVQLIRNGVVRDVSNIGINIMSKNRAMQIYMSIFYQYYDVTLIIIFSSIFFFLKE